MSKLIPFIKDKPKTPAPVLYSQGPKKSVDGKIVDHGKLGVLDYEVYERGVIHIFDKVLKFKKDIFIFEDDIKRIKFDKMSDGEEYEIKGSGSNDHLLFRMKNGDLEISLKKRELEGLALLKGIINKGKQKLQMGGSK